MPESAEFQHGKKMFEESREALTRVAHFNSVYTVNKEPYEDYHFIQEMSTIDVETRSDRHKVESDGSDVSDTVIANK